MVPDLCPPEMTCKTTEVVEYQQVNIHLLTFNLLENFIGNRVG